MNEDVVMRKWTALVIGLAIIGYAAGVVLADEHGRWVALKNDPGCVVWSPTPQEQETYTWTGDCVGGKAQGRGVKVRRLWIGGEWQENRYDGDMKGGKNEGRGTLYFADGRLAGDGKVAAKATITLEGLGAETVVTGDIELV